MFIFFLGVQSANTMLWLLYDLARNSRAQEKLHEEVIEVLGRDGNVTAKEIPKLPYLKACTRESMRYQAKE